MKCEVPECNNDSTGEIDLVGGWTICSACIEKHYGDE